MKNKIIKECKKYGYEFKYEREESGLLVFTNDNVIEELQVFHVQINEDLEMVSMAIITDLGSWNNAIDSDLKNEQSIMENIKGWLSEENRTLYLEWLESEVEQYMKRDKENAVIDFMQMNRNSWTWAKLTFQERMDFANTVDWAISQNVIFGAYEQRYKTVHALYYAFLVGLGYGKENWREE